MAEARCDNIAEVMEAEASPEAMDPLVRDFDLYLSTAATLTETEAMEAQQAERRLPIYAAIIAKESPKITKPDAN
ncbi:hypothetical protein PoB_007668400 [Plakobranchus ocellatus]|uniref:Uncharacterized protein n=1 Tax=Plakobranchus ocellatus TaxID=259542 RepID=A0AAV4E1L2_9GAST|nr:hypothetical protein PoB_007668400 [Plakobranchus ocellatus]